MPSATPTSVVDQLRAEFCPPLDSSLFAALLLDFPEPLSEDDAYLIRETLKALANEHDEAQLLAANGAVNSADTSELGSALEVWSLDDGPGGPDRRFWDASHLSSTSGEGEDDLASARLDEPDDPLAFLANVFPEVSLEKLQDRLEAAGGDTEQVVDDLLSEDYIGSLEQEEGEEPASTPSTSKGSGKQERRRAKAALKASSKVSLTSPAVLLRAGPPRPPSPSLPAISQAAPSTNHWASINSHSSHLATLLHIAPQEVTSMYHQSSSSIARTLSKLLDRLIRERPFSALPEADSLKLQLALILPGVNGQKLEMLLSATNGDLSDALDLNTSIAEIERTEGRLTWTELIAPGSPPPPPPSSSTASAPHTSTSSTAEVLRHRPDAVTTVARAPETYSHADCVAFEQEFLERRNDAMRSAARHFQRGGMSQRGAAYYWADEGRKLDAKRRVWAERGASALVRERRIYDKNTIDLHGLTLAHAQKVVHEGCNTWWATSTHTLSPPPLRIITGVGRHSAGNNPVLMPSITKQLTRENWRWKWDGYGHGSESRGAVVVLGLVR